jgi:hypothetical protein
MKKQNALSQKTFVKISQNFGVPSRETLSLAELKSILSKSENEIETLPPGEQRMYLDIRELAAMCGGWSEPEDEGDSGSEPTLRTHLIY